MESSVAGSDAESAQLRAILPEADIQCVVPSSQREVSWRRFPSEDGPLGCMPLLRSAAIHPDEK